MAPIITSTYILMTTIIVIKLIEASIGSIDGHHYDNFICYPFDNSMWKWQVGAKNYYLRCNTSFYNYAIVDHFGQSMSQCICCWGMFLGPTRR